jgi:D-alanyl-D-alanine carboxypeptidase
VVGVRRTVLLLASVFLAMLLASGVALGVTPLGDTAEKTDADATAAARGPDAALDRALKELIAMPGGPPGVIAVVQRGQHREVHAFGAAKLGTQWPRPPRVDDRMRIASAAKAFSGAVALSLVSKGALSLDDTIEERLSGLPKPPPDDWSEVTLRQLLNHTSGLPDYTEDPGFLDALRASPAQAPPPEKLLTYVYDHDPPLLFDSGSKYRYSNSDNIAVALMVEAATGRSYEGQLQKQVYGPLGLRKTTLPAGPNLREPYIHGYDLSERPPEDGSELLAAGWAWASGGIVSTPADLNTFIRAYVRGDLFDLRTRTQQRKVFEGGGSEPPGPGENSAGLGVFRYETMCGTVWGHTGNIPGGYTQFMAASPYGSRSATVSVNSRLTPTVGDPEAFKALRRAEVLAVCAALAGKG